jgi:hypothetical protein
MSRWLTDAFEQAVDLIRDHRVLHSIFWPSLTVMAVGFTLAMGPFALLAPLSAALIAWQTTRVGLARVRLLVWLPGAVFITSVAFAYVGLKDKVDRMGVVDLLGFVAALVCVSSFSALLTALDRRRRHALGEPTEEPKAAFRASIIKLVVITLAMLTTSGVLVSLACLFALLRRRRWTAILAGTSSAALVLWTFRADDVAIVIHVLEIGLGLLGAYQWYRVAFQPWWLPKRFWSIP